MKHFIRVETTATFDMLRDMLVANGWTFYKSDYRSLYRDVQLIRREDSVLITWSK